MFNIRAIKCDVPPPQTLHIPRRRTTTPPYQILQHSARKSQRHPRSYTSPRPTHPHPLPDRKPRRSHSPRNHTPQRIHFPSANPLIPAFLHIPVQKPTCTPRQSIPDATLDPLPGDTVILGAVVEVPACIGGR